MGTLRNIISLKLSAILIIVSLAMGMIIVNRTYMDYESAGKKLDTFSNMFDRNNTVFVDPELRVFEEGVYYYPGIHEVYLNEISKLENSKYINNIYMYGQDMPIPDELHKRLPDKYQQNAPMESLKYNQLLIINNSYMDRNNLKVVSGRTFEEEDFKKDFSKESIPILVGNEYLELVQIGEEFTIECPVAVDKNDNMIIGKITFEIIGVLEKDTIPFLNKSRTPGEFNTQAIFENTASVMPLVENNYFFGYGYVIGGYGFFVELRDMKYLDEVKEILDDAFLKVKPVPMKAVIYDLKETFGQNEGYFFRDVQTSFAIGILFIFISITGAVAILLGKLQERKREFGIKKALGATNIRLAFDVLKEISGMTILSSILSIFSILAISKVKITTEFIVFDLIIVIIITIVISVIPIIAIIKEDVVNMIRGRE